MLLWYSSGANPEPFVYWGHYSISWVYKWPNKPKYLGVNCFSTRAELLRWNQLSLADQLPKRDSHGVASSGFFFQFLAFMLTEKMGIGRKTKRGKWAIYMEGKQQRMHVSLYTGSVRVLVLFSITSVPGSSGGWPHCSGSCLGGVAQFWASLFWTETLESWRTTSIMKEI